MTTETNNPSEYVAIAKDQRIISVLARDYEDAKKQIMKQLSKPGRTAYKEVWIAEGCQIQ